MSKGIIANLHLKSEVQSCDHVKFDRFFISFPIVTFGIMAVECKMSRVFIPEWNGLEGKPMRWRVRSNNGRGRRHGHRQGVLRRQRQRRRRQRAVGRRRHALQLGQPRRARAPGPAPPRRLLCLALRARNTPLPLRLHRTVYITTDRRILHLHYDTRHDPIFGRDSYRDRFGRDGQPHLVAGDRAWRRARMTTAARRLSAPSLGQGSVGAGAREGRRAALVRLP